MRETDEIAGLLGRLVACPSVNPGAAEGPFAPPFGEARLAELLAGILSGWGADVRLDEVSPGRPNLIACFEGVDPGRSIVLEAHNDTVRADNMTVPPFEPTVRNGRLHGRGACDAKGAMAAMLLGLKGVLDARGRPPVTTVFVSTCDEELGGGGARALLAGGFRADAAVVGEPTDLEIVHAHRGAVRWRVMTRGEPAHSSRAPAGANAIYHMRRVLEFVDGPYADALAMTPPHPLLGGPSVSVGTIRGGTQVNVIPSLCEIEVDRRTLPGERREDVTRGFREALDRLAAELGFELDLRETQWYPPLDEPRDSPLATVVGEACGEALGDARFAGAAWASNAGFFSEAGIPSVVFGPGSVEQAHAADEHVLLEDVAKAARVYSNIIRAFASA